MNTNSKYSKYLKFNLKKFNINERKLDSNVFNDILNIINSAIEHMLTWLMSDNNILQMMHDDLYDSIYEYAYDIVHAQYIIDWELDGSNKNAFNYSPEKYNKLVVKCVKIAQSFVFKFITPRRSYGKSYIRKNMDNVSFVEENAEKIHDRLEILKSIKQPEQRSDEWYLFRNTTLTASNIWKIFGSECSQTQLILEKCEPININKYKTTNTNSPMHWGQKYEPVSILYYEYIHNTTVTEFGCIPHDKYKYLAASPDGIICDDKSELFGRMLEIKNVVSREITGIPKMEYWIQMQLQMEVCGLNECDFLETKFLEYESEEDYMNDIDRQYKGIILQYVKNDNPYYVYAPFMLIDQTSNEYKEWVTTAEQTNKDMEYVQTLYWKMEKISCVLVLRNKLWFDAIHNSIETFWNNLVYERESEKYKERIKNKRKLEIYDFKIANGLPQGCLIDSKLFS